MLMTYSAPEEEISQPEIVSSKQQLANLSHVKDTFAVETLL